MAAAPLPTAQFAPLLIVAQPPRMPPVVFAVLVERTLAPVGTKSSVPPKPPRTMAARGSVCVARVSLMMERPALSVTPVMFWVFVPVRV